MNQEFSKPNKELLFMFALSPFLTLHTIKVFLKTGKSDQLPR